MGHLSGKREGLLSERPAPVLMRAIHRRLERKTAPEAAGLIAVSQTYIDLLRTAYPQIATKPACLSPFGCSRADFDAAQRVGQVSPALKSASGEGTVTCLFAGRVAPAMERALANLFSIVAEARAAGVSTFQRLRFVFVGTGYGGGVTERMASRLAEAAGIADQITELSERIPLLDAWRSSLEADCLLVLGSEDAGYIPSKLNAILSLRKPLICAAPRNCLVYEETKDITTVVAISPDIEPQTVELADRLKALLAGGGDYQERQLRCQPNEAHECARIDCALFDKALEAASPP
ncbi:MAG: hypothetical protein WCI21_02470, partial [Alphaproteobacteria bacterium]